MQINSVRKLPAAKKSLYNSVFNEAKKHTTDRIAHKVAAKVLSEHKPSPRVGKKSIAPIQTVHETGESKITGTFIDVLLGRPEIDYYGQYLSREFWENKPIGVIKGDFNHYYADRAEGLITEDEPVYEGWVPVIQKFWNEEDGSLWGRAELPEGHPFTPTFIEGWESGKYGASIELVVPEEAVEYQFMEGQLIEVGRQGIITGFTFAEAPALRTKNNGR